MRILFYLYPALLSQGPEFNRGWSLLLLNIMRGLVAAGRECHMITASRFKETLGSDLDGLSISYIDELALHQDVIEIDPGSSIPSELSRLVRSAPDDQPAVVNLLKKQIVEACGNFMPDVVITFAMQADYIKSIWPSAHVFYTEAGAFSRSPYPFTMFFDHQGMYSRSVAAQLQDDAIDVDRDVLALAHDIRAHAAQMLEETDPFADFDFREKFERLVLFPLQVSNYFSFDDQAPYRTQFEFLLEVLSSAPKDVGIIVTEYIQWGEVIRSEGPAQNLEWLSRTFPNFIFKEEFRNMNSPSQYLAARVDGLITICSNLGYQALLLGKRLGCGYDSFLKNVAHDQNIQQFFNNLKQKAPLAGRLNFLAWYIERYAIPESLFNDGHWFSDYLARRIKAIEAASKPEEGFVPIATPDVLRKCWLEPVTKEIVGKWGAEPADLPKQGECFVPLRVGESRVIDFSPAAPHAFLAEGFHTPEVRGVWCSGKYAKIVLPIDQAITDVVELHISMVLKVFGGIMAHAPVLQIKMDGQEVGFVLFRESAKNEQEVTFFSRIKKPVCQIEFHISHAGSPASLSQSPDQRELSFWLSALSIAVLPVNNEVQDETGAELMAGFWGVSGSEVASGVVSYMPACRVS